MDCQSVELLTDIVKEKGVAEIIDDYVSDLYLTEHQEKYQANLDSFIKFTLNGIEMWQYKLIHGSYQFCKIKTLNKKIKAQDRTADHSR